MRAWAVGSAIYTIAAVALSVGPIQHAMVEAGRPAAAAAPVTVGDGPIPEAPDSPKVRFAKTVGERALIVVVPPFLALWFGWDVWFAVEGFRSRQRKDAGEDGA